MSQFPIILITGFLGSGKTTLINRLLKNQELKNTALLINEPGEIAVDHHLVHSVSDSVTVVSNGCICCTIRGELSAALDKLYKQWQHYEIPSFERVIIETTGLADPVPILYELLKHPLIRQNYYLASVITCVDALLGLNQLNRHPEALKQTAVADRLIITKQDLTNTDHENTQTLIQQLTALNPTAECIVSVNNDIEIKWIQQLRHYDPTNKFNISEWSGIEKYKQVPGQTLHSTYHGSVKQSAKNYHGRIQSFCIGYEEPLDWNALLKGLEVILSLQGHQILRIKGLVHVQGESLPRVIHCMQHLIFDTVSLNEWPLNFTPKTQLVFIVIDLKSDFISLTLNHFLQKQHTL